MYIPGWGGGGDTVREGRGANGRDTNEKVNAETREGTTSYLNTLFLFLFIWLARLACPPPPYAA